MEWKYKVVPRDAINQGLVEQLDREGRHGWELAAVVNFSLIFKRPVEVPNEAVSAILVLTDSTGGSNLPGQITVDTTNETATVAFVDDKGDTNAAAPVSPDGGAIVVTFTSDNEAVLTIATDGTNPLQGDVTAVAEGTANVGATIADDQGNPVLEPDGVTPFAVDSVAVTVGPGEAEGAALVLSV